VHISAWSGFFVVIRWVNGHAIGAGGAGYKVEELFGYPSDNDEKTTPGAYVHTTLIKKWDICSGNALLNHFGGQMTKLNGEDIDYHHSLSPKNEGGLVAALHDHQKYLDAFKDYVHA
jgi:inositol monophosphatase 3